MFMAALFTTKRWKQTKCPLAAEWKIFKVDYTYNGVLVSLKKERNSDTCYNVDEH
jgi:hypothetical protein